MKVRRPPPLLSSAEIALVRSLVIYEDATILVLNKPSGLSSQGGRGQANTLDEMLHAFADARGDRPRLIHRLDRDTSGVILTAKTKPAAAFLGRALTAHAFSKTYQAVLSAAPEAFEGEVAAPLRREETGREAYMRVCPPEHPDAETALSRYRTLAVAAHAALVELSPKTGRMHQLRVHMAHIGRPIAGDSRYGGALVLGGQAAPRLMLHAAALEFPHPHGGRRRIEAAQPADFKGLAQRLGLSGGAAA